MEFKTKYLKYKLKYFKLKNNLKGGSVEDPSLIDPEVLKLEYMNHETTQARKREIFNLMLVRNRYLNQEITTLDQLRTRIDETEPGLTNMISERSFPIYENYIDITNLIKNIKLEDIKKDKYNRILRHILRLSLNRTNIKILKGYSEEMWQDKNPQEKKDYDNDVNNLIEIPYWPEKFRFYKNEYNNYILSIYIDKKYMLDRKNYIVSLTFPLNYPFVPPKIIAYDSETRSGGTLFSTDPRKVKDKWTPNYSLNAFVINWLNHNFDTYVVLNINNKIHLHDNSVVNIVKEKSIQL